jgi:hypothetical protein
MTNAQVYAAWGRDREIARINWQKHQDLADAVKLRDGIQNKTGKP